MALAQHWWKTIAAKRETVSVEDLALSNAYQLEAMINVLERKGLLTKAEVLEELKGMRVGNIRDGSGG